MPPRRQREQQARKRSVIDGFIADKQRLKDRPIDEAAIRRQKEGTRRKLVYR